MLLRFFKDIPNKVILLQTVERLGSLNERLAALFYTQALFFLLLTLVKPQFTEMRYLTLALALLFFSPLLQAQAPCGVTAQDAAQIKARMLQNRADIDRARIEQFQNSRNTKYIPIAFHIVGTNSGDGYINENNVLDNLCTLNDHYAPQGVQFYLHNGVFNYLNNSVLYNHTSSNGARLAMAAAKKSGAINIYIGNSAGGSSSGGTILGYYAPGQGLDYIFLIKNATGGGQTTMTHEVGHYFTLPHPFNGWEGETYDPSQPTPLNIGFSNTLVEYQDGRNCTLSGDGFCDTKPNYNLGFSNSTCNYTGGAVDPDGVLIDPDEDNYMSYFPDACQTRFTSDQQAAIAADIVARGWSNSITPPASALSGNVNLTYPINNQVAPLGVTLQWSAVGNASGYVVELYENIAGVALQRILVDNSTTNSYTIPASLMQDNRQYRWTVRPYNSYYVCRSGPAASSDFISSLAANVVSPDAMLSDAKIFPNPSTAGNAQLEVQSQDAQIVALRIVDINGRVLVEQSNIWLNNGPTLIDLPTATLASGFYVVELNGENGTLRRKLQIR